MKLEKDFEKVFCIDTNIILDDANHIFNISQGGKNLIILPETTLDEVDTKKSGLEEINFQARQFGRILSEAEVIGTKKVGNLKDITIMSVKVKDCYVDIISVKNYMLDGVDKAILNDRKIIKVATIAKSLYKKPLVLLSNDIMCRTRAISLGVPTQALLSNSFCVDELEFHKQIDEPNYNGKNYDFSAIETHITSVEITDSIGKKYFYFRNKNGLFEELDETNIKKFPAPPINLLQKVASQVIYDETDLTVIFGNAGCGKTLIALSSAMRLCDTKNYKKIYYMRRTIISGDSEDELGFLPGDLTEKMKGYNYPMEDALYKLARLKKRDASKEELDEIVENYRIKYDIEYLYAGHSRGMNLDENSILILDEVQNNTVSTIKTIVSRISKDSVCIVLGSNNQIDSKYLSKNNNGLTALIEQSKKDNSISLRVIELKNIIRSKHAEWVDRVF